MNRMIALALLLLSACDSGADHYQFRLINIEDTLVCPPNGVRP